MPRNKSDHWVTPEGLMLISGWAMDGLTDEDIAKNMGIATSTLYVWKKRIPEISEPLKKNKEIADRVVENALYKRATGYDQESVKVFQYKGNPVVVPVLEHIPPDTTAAIFWLKNRQASKWRDKPASLDIEIEGRTGVVILPQILEVDEWGKDTGGDD